MAYRMFWGTDRPGPPVETVGADRTAIEDSLHVAEPDVTWAEVFDHLGMPVARKLPSRQGLAGLPGARGWGHVCPACRELAGRDCLLARQHARLVPVSGPLGRRSYCCCNCGTGMARDEGATNSPPSWVIRTWPDVGTRRHAGVAP